MSKKEELPTTPLSRRESQIMDILFSKGESSVITITELMPDDLSRNGVRTFLTILKGKGHITRHKSGREFLYAAATNKESAVNTALSKVLEVFFNGSLSTAIAAQFTNKEKIKENELEELQQLINAAREKN